MFVNGLCIFIYCNISFSLIPYSRWFGWLHRWRREYSRYVYLSDFSYLYYRLILIFKWENLLMQKSVLLWTLKHLFFNGWMEARDASSLSRIRYTPMSKVMSYFSLMRLMAEPIVPMICCFSWIILLWRPLLCFFTEIGKWSFGHLFVKTNRKPCKQVKMLWKMYIYSFKSQTHHIFFYLCKSANKKQIQQKRERKNSLFSSQMAIATYTEATSKKSLICF